MAPKSKSVIGSTREDRSSKLNNFEKVNFEVAEPQSAILLLHSNEQPVVYKEQDDIIQEFASLLLAEFTTERYACIKVMENPIIGVLLERMASRDPDIQKNSLQDIDCKDIHKKVLNLLEVVSTTEVSAKHIAEVNGPQRLKEYMHTIKDTELVEAALAIIIELATFKSGRQILHELNMVKDLSSLLKSGKSSIMGKACRGLALMSQYYESLQTIIAENPIKEIVNTIISDQYPMSTRLAAAQALRKFGVFIESAFGIYSR
ncbi:hypothetical protein C0J52_04016 [Blattella germanica]|nr:hypothetical protein C0J52_04016 [Blattella germanica]